MEDTCVSKVENENGKSSRVSVSGSKLTTLVPRMIRSRIKQKKKIFKENFEESQFKFIKIQKILAMQLTLLMQIFFCEIKFSSSNGDQERKACF